MNQLDGLRRYLEAATTLTQITHGRAEEFVRDLVASGELERTRAQEWIEDLLQRSREASETLVASISAEVDRQLGDRGLKNLDLDDLAQKVAAILEHAGTVGRNVSVPRMSSRGAGGAAAPSAQGRPASPNGAGRDVKAKSGAGKKKDGSPKPSSKQGKKSESKSDSKKSESKKNGSKKSGSDEERSSADQPAVREPVIAKIEEQPQPVDHGVAP